MPDEDVVSLLPSNSSSVELAIEEVSAQSANLPAVRFWSIDGCPEELLPWLARTLSVDSWDGAWPAIRKRDVIRASVQVHQKKGTFYAVRMALAALGYEARVVEWHRNSTVGDPFTYELLFDQSQVPALLDDIRKAVAAVDATKSARSHMVQVGMRVSSEAGPAVGIASFMGNQIIIEQSPYGAALHRNVVVVS